MLCNGKNVGLRLQITVGEPATQLEEFDADVGEEGGREGGERVKPGWRGGMSRAGGPDEYIQHPEQETPKETQRSLSSRKIAQKEKEKGREKYLVSPCTYSFRQMSHWEY